MTTATDRYAAALETLTAHGQRHLLKWFDQLDEAGRAQLLDQVESIDWSQLDRLIATYVKQKPSFEIPRGLEPAPFYPVDPPAELGARYDRARQAGEQLVRDGKVAAFVVAGGSGTRLGYDGPKGTFPSAPLSGKTLFQQFADQISRNQQKYGCVIPWYIMTSPANDAATRAYFEHNDYLGLDRANVMFFAQGTMPSIAYDGRLFLADKDSLVLNADGHGGSLKALYRSGAIDDMKRRGVEQISYFQVDNPIVKVIDPLFLGLHALDGAQMSSKMVAKNYGMEKLGNFCLIDGHVTIVEYSDLPEQLANDTLDDGELRFKAGSPAIHAIAVDFVAELNATGELSLPFHRADKKVPHIDFETGQPVEPDEPNGVKLEQFVFDALPLCETSIVLQTDRDEEMAFIKNAEGESSPESSKRLQVERAGRWLAAAGVDVPRDGNGNVDATIEISYLTAVDGDDLAGAELPNTIERGSAVIL